MRAFTRPAAMMMAVPCVHQAGGDDDGGAVLIVVEDGDVQACL